MMGVKEVNCIFYVFLFGFTFNRFFSEYYWFSGVGRAALCCSLGPPPSLTQETIKNINFI